MAIGPFHHGPASAFPAKSTWKPFNDLFNLNKPEMFATGDSGEDIGRMYNAIVEAAKTVGVEERVILCIIMQESSGNVGVGSTTDQGAKADGGLMQARESPAFPGRHHLSQHDITSMVLAGTKHFKGNLKQVGDHDTAECIYEACRLYNSGSMNKNDLSDGRGATASYVSDIANRLQGYHH